MKKILLFGFGIFIFLSGCRQSNAIDDITNFTTKSEGDYLLFHLIDPYDDKGYIIELNESGDEVEKYVITDQRFAPADVFAYQNQFYFASGAYSGDTGVMSYNPATHKISMVETNQDRFIEKYYKDSVSEYITTLSDENGHNTVCDIIQRESMTWKGYTAYDITSLNDSLIIVGVQHNQISTTKNLTVVRKYDRDFNLIKEIKLDSVPNYFTHTSLDQKLYLFIETGEIIEIDSDLNTTLYPLDLPNKSQNFVMSFNKNVVLDNGDLVMNIKLQEVDTYIDCLARISFKNHIPYIELIDNSHDESIINADEKAKEVYTRSYVNKKAVIKVRDMDDLRVKHEFKLKNANPIYFVDNIK